MWQSDFVKVQVSSLSQAYSIRSLIRRAKPTLPLPPSPTDHTICINTDGSTLGNPGHAGMGYIISTADGSFILASATYIGITTNNMAELWAIREALKQAQQSRCTNVTIYTDSLFAFSCIHRKEMSRTMHQPLLQEILEVSHQLQEIRICFVYRELNQAADHLAKIGSTRNFSQPSLLDPSSENCSSFAGTPFNCKYFWNICPQVGFAS